MTDDERRERYAAAIAAVTFGRADDDAVVCAADAAMAVADAENASLRAALADHATALHERETEADRLRAELKLAAAQRWQLAQRVIELNALHYGYDE